MCGLVTVCCYDCCWWCLLWRSDNDDNAVVWVDGNHEQNGWQSSQAGVCVSYRSVSTACHLTFLGLIAKNVAVLDALLQFVILCQKMECTPFRVALS